jgi:hypothetical protein
MENCDYEFKNIIVRLDANGKIVFKECLKNISKITIDLEDNSFSIELKNGFENCYDMKNHNPLENYNFQIV